MKIWKRSLQPTDKLWVLLLSAVLFFLAAALSLCLGAANLTPSQLLAAISAGPKAGGMSTIFYYVRLPRTAACLLAGAALAVAGAVIQHVLANPLASPSIIGVNAGAGAAVTLCCAVGALSGWAIAGASFLGALAAVTLVSFAAQKTGASRSTVILSGVAVNSILNAFSEGIVQLVPEAGMLSVDFRVGGFSSVAHTRLLPAACLILLALAVSFSLSTQLDVISLGDDTALSLGLPVKKLRLLFLALAAVLCGAAVSFSGLLGFVGLIVPHAARTFVGSESKYLLPLCALGGSAFVAVCDLAARLVFAPFELPVGILLAVMGGPFFLFLLYKSKGGKRK